MQYGQNISIPYSQPQNDHNNMFSNDHKDNILKTKMERDREDGKLVVVIVNGFMPANSSTNSIPIFFSLVFVFLQ